MAIPTIRKLEKAVAVQNCLLEKFSGKFRRCWKIPRRFSGSTKCYPYQGLGAFRQGKRLLENWPRLRERCWIFSSETATAFLSSSETKSFFCWDEKLVGIYEFFCRPFQYPHLNFTCVWWQVGRSVSPPFEVDPCPEHPRITTCTPTSLSLHNVPRALLPSVVLLFLPMFVCFSSSSGTSLSTAVPESSWGWGGHCGRGPKETMPF